MHMGQTGKRPRRPHYSTRRANGPALRFYRENLDLTLEQLQKRSGVSYTTISRIETGETDGPRKSTLEALARALGVEYEKLVIRQAPEGIAQNGSKNGK